MCLDTPVDSGYSFKSDDLECMEKLKDLICKEKTLMSEIEDMQNQEHAFMNALDPIDLCDCREADEEKTRKEEIALIKRIEEANEKLMDENERIIDELKDLKFNLKYCMENVQGPLSRQLDRQKRVSQQLEAQLCDKTVESNAKLCCYIKQINSLKRNICTNSEKLCEVNASNARMEDEIADMKGRYRALQKALVGEKIKEAEMLARLGNCECSY